MIAASSRGIGMVHLDPQLPRSYCLRSLCDPFVVAQTMEMEPESSQPLLIVMVHLYPHLLQDIEARKCRTYCHQYILHFTLPEHSNKTLRFQTHPFTYYHKWMPSPSYLSSPRPATLFLNPPLMGDGFRRIWQWVLRRYEGGR
jgi:hypothetical protein